MQSQQAGGQPSRTLADKISRSRRLRYMAGQATPGTARADNVEDNGTDNQNLPSVDATQGSGQASAKDQPGMMSKAEKRKALAKAHMKQTVAGIQGSSSAEDEKNQQQTSSASSLSEKRRRAMARVGQRVSTTAASPNKAIKESTYTDSAGGDKQRVSKPPVSVEEPAGQRGSSHSLLNKLSSLGMVHRGRTPATSSSTSVPPPPPPPPPKSEPHAEPPANPVTPTSASKNAVVANNSTAVHAALAAARPRLRSSPEAAPGHDGKEAQKEKEQSSLAQKQSASRKATLASGHRRFQQQRARQAQANSVSREQEPSKQDPTAIPASTSSLPLSPALNHSQYEPELVDELQNQTKAQESEEPEEEPADLEIVDVPPPMIQKAADRVRSPVPQPMNTSGTEKESMKTESEGEDIRRDFRGIRSDERGVQDNTQPEAATSSRVADMKARYLGSASPVPPPLGRSSPLLSKRSPSRVAGPPEPHVQKEAHIGPQDAQKQYPVAQQQMPSPARMSPAPLFGQQSPGTFSGRQSPAHQWGRRSPAPSAVSTASHGSSVMGRQSSASGRAAVVVTQPVGAPDLHLLSPESVKGQESPATEENDGPESSPVKVSQQRQPQYQMYSPEAEMPSFRDSMENAGRPQRLYDSEMNDHPRDEALAEGPRSPTKTAGMGGTPIQYPRSHFSSSTPPRPRADQQNQDRSTDQTGWMGRKDDRSSATPTSNFSQRRASSQPRPVQHFNSTATATSPRNASGDRFQNRQIGKFEGNYDPPSPRHAAPPSSSSQLSPRHVAHETSAMQRADGENQSCGGVGSDREIASRSKSMPLADGRATLEIPEAASVSRFKAQFDRPENVVLHPDRTIVPKRTAPTWQPGRSKDHGENQEIDTDSDQQVRESLEASPTSKWQPRKGPTRSEQYNRRYPDHQRPQDSRPEKQPTVMDYWRNRIDGPEEEQLDSHDPRKVATKKWTPQNSGRQGQGPPYQPWSTSEANLEENTATEMAIEGNERAVIEMPQKVNVANMAGRFQSSTASQVHPPVSPTHSQGKVPPTMTRNSPLRKEAFSAAGSGRPSWARQQDLSPYEGQGREHTDEMAPQHSPSKNGVVHDQARWRSPSPVGISAENSRRKPQSGMPMPSWMRPNEGGIEPNSISPNDLPSSHSLPYENGANHNVQALSQNENGLVGHQSGIAAGNELLDRQTMNSQHSFNGESVQDYSKLPEKHRSTLYRTNSSPHVGRNLPDDPALSSSPLRRALSPSSQLNRASDHPRSPTEKKRTEGERSHPPDLSVAAESLSTENSAPAAPSPPAARSPSQAERIAARERAGTIQHSVTADILLPPMNRASNPRNNRRFASPPTLPPAARSKDAFEELQKKLLKRQHDIEITSVASTPMIQNLSSTVARATAVVMDGGNRVTEYRQSRDLDIREEKKSDDMYPHVTDRDYSSRTGEDQEKMRAFEELGEPPVATDYRGGIESFNPATEDAHVDMSFKDDKVSVSGNQEKDDQASFNEGERKGAELVEEDNADFDDEANGSHEHRERTFDNTGPPKASVAQALESPVPRTAESPRTLVELAALSIHAVDYEQAAYGLQQSTSRSHSLDDEENSKDASAIPENMPLPPEFASAVAQRTLANEPNAQYPRTDVKDNQKIQGVNTKTSQNHQHYGHDNNSPTPPRVPYQPSKRISDPIELESEPGAESDVVFGDPTTFGTAGSGDPGRTTPTVADRAKAIAMWKGGKGAKSTPPDAGRARRDSDASGASAEKYGLVEREHKQDQRQSSAVLRFWKNTSQEEVEGAQNWKDDDPGVGDYVSDMVSDVADPPLYMKRIVSNAGRVDQTSVGPQQIGADGSGHTSHRSHTVDVEARGESTSAPDPFSPSAVEALRGVSKQKNPSSSNPFDSFFGTSPEENRDFKDNDAFPSSDGFPPVSAFTQGDDGFNFGAVSGFGGPNDFAPVATKLAPTEQLSNENKKAWPAGDAFGETPNFETSTPASDGFEDAPNFEGNGRPNKVADANGFSADAFPDFSSTKLVDPFNNGHGIDSNGFSAGNNFPSAATREEVGSKVVPLKPNRGDSSGNSGRRRSGGRNDFQSNPTAAMAGSLKDGFAGVKKTDFTKTHVSSTDGFGSSDGFGNMETIQGFGGSSGKSSDGFGSVDNDGFVNPRKDSFGNAGVFPSDFTPTDNVRANTTEDLFLPSSSSSLRKSSDTNGFPNFPSTSKTAVVESNSSLNRPNSQNSSRSYHGDVAASTSTPLRPPSRSSSGEEDQKQNNLDRFISGAPSQPILDHFYTEAPSTQEPIWSFETGIDTVYFDRQAEQQQTANPDGEEC